MAALAHFPTAMRLLGVQVQMNITNSEVAEDRFEDLSNLFFAAVTEIPGGNPEIVHDFHNEAANTWDIIEANRIPLPGYHLALAPPAAAPFFNPDSILEYKSNEAARGA